MGLRPFHLCPLIKPESLLGHRAGQSSSFFQFLGKEGGRDVGRIRAMGLFLTQDVAAEGWLISGLEDELAQVK